MNIEELEKAILVWRFEDAPLKYRSLLSSGGDEDYLAIVPEGLWTSYESEDSWSKEKITRYDVPRFLDSEQFGACDRQFHELSCKSLIVVGSHA